MRSGFFNSINGDRKHDAGFFAEYFATFIGNGIFPNPSTNLQVIANDDMTVTVKKGKAWIDGYVLFNDNDYTFDIDVADGVLNRIDRLVLRFDVGDREIRAEIKKSEFATNPIAPAIQRDSDAYELALADIFIKNGSISVTQADITDTRLNGDLCGVVQGLVKQVDTTSIFNQYQDWYTRTKKQAEGDIEDIKFNFIRDWNEWYSQSTGDWEVEFNTWFSNLKILLEDDVAANLTQQIIDINEKLDDFAKGINKFRVGNVENFKSKSMGRLKIEISMGDPLDSIVIDESGNEVTLAKWKGTMVRGKLNSYPVDINDGNLIFDNTERDKYKRSPFLIDFLNDGDEWFFMAFPYTEKDVYTIDSANRDSAIALDKLPREAPAMPNISNLEFDRVTVVGEIGSVVSVDKAIWHPSPHTFTGLTEETNYKAYAKFLETDTHLESSLSPARLFTTEAEADPNSWEGIQKIVRKGMARDFFSIGDQVASNYDNGEIIWEVIGIDEEEPVDNQYQHSMTLQAKDCLEDRVWESSNDNRYINSSIKTYLNNEFLNKLDPELSAILGPVKKKVAKRDDLGGGQDNFNDKVFLLSRVEVGLGTEGTTTGEKVYSFYDGIANAARIKNLNGSPRHWWLRSPRVGGSNFVRYVDTSGAVNRHSASTSYGVTPACVII